MPPEITQSIIQLANFDHSNKANNIHGLTMRIKIILFKIGP